MTVIEFPAGQTVGSAASARLSHTIGRYRFDPLGFVEFDMRRRGLALPDDGDALALTFAYPVQRRDWQEEWRLEERLASLRRYAR